MMKSTDSTTILQTVITAPRKSSTYDKTAVPAYDKAAISNTRTQYRVNDDDTDARDLKTNRLFTT